LLYVLDIDDTLYLERDFVRSGFEAVARWIEQYRGIGGFFQKAWDLFQNGFRERIFDTVLGAMNIYEPGLVTELVDCYRSHKPMISLLPDSQDFLKECQRDDLAIITDGLSLTQRNKISRLQVDLFVGRIIITGDWGQHFWKPHPRAFWKVMAGRPMSECCYIADNPRKDFIAPAALGWSPSIRIRRTGSLHYDVPTPEGCIEINSLAELEP
jgi:putative hydrolase of the HAD superfamily